MDYITTTQLRTQSSELVRHLNSGMKVLLLHRSKVVGAIVPENEAYKTFDSQSFADFVETNMPKKLMKKTARDLVYKKHMLEKYG